MDIAVALVRAYLQLNGYFTLTEYPVVRRLREGEVRTLTEIDIAAYRLVSEPDYAPDRALKVPLDRPDMIIGEVKEGRAMINDSAMDPDVVAKILRRFGCARERDSKAIAHKLLSQGRVATGRGHDVRLVAFGSWSDEPSPYLKVMLSDVVAYIDRYLSENWDVARAAGTRDPVFGLMVLLEKARGRRP